MDETQFTIDGVGDIVVCQPRKGFRFCTDALLLYISLQKKEYSTILDIGAGTGVVSFLCTQRFPNATVVSVEIHDEMYTYLEKGIVENTLQDRICTFQGDIADTDLRQFRPFDLIVSNPPYRAAGSGQISPYSSKNSAIYDTTLSPEKLFESIQQNSNDRTDIAVCYSHDRHSTYLYAAMTYGIYPNTIISYIQGSGEMLTVTLFSRILNTYPEHRFVVENSWKSEIDLLYKGG